MPVTINDVYLLICKVLLKDSAASADKMLTLSGNVLV